MPLEFQGRARRLGDDINTDYIIASTRKKETLDEAVLKRYLLETVDPAFAASVREGDVIVAGRNFGGGSAMEIAVTVILAAGIKAVVAQSFARTFFRNAINNGLVPVECNTSSIGEGEALSIAVGVRGATVTCVASQETLIGAPLSVAVLGILESGGLVAYLRAHGGRLT